MIKYYELAGFHLALDSDCDMVKKSQCVKFCNQSFYDSRKKIKNRNDILQIAYHQKEGLNCCEGCYRACINVIMPQGVLHLHSSYVLYQGKAILFTGPSGIGKTTQAELWRDYADGLIVNGDVALIRKVDGVWTAFGTPIHGSSPYCENRQAPIVALIRLDQGKENMLEPMNGYKALTTCLPEFYHPKLEPETEEVFWHTIDEFFSEIPVYHMTCRPDREAVELVKNEFFDK